MRALALSVLVACGGDSRAKPTAPRAPAFQRDVDQVLAVKPTPRTVDAPSELAPIPWRAGQWALYRVTDKSSIGYMRYRALREDTCGMWFEQTIANPQHRMVVQLCVKSPPDLTTTTQATLQLDAGAAQPLSPLPKHVALPGAGWEQQSGAPRETIAVPAGSFAGTVKTTQPIKGVETTVWSHPAIPLAGTVKAQAATGVTTELVDFGG